MAWDDDKSNAADPDNPNADEQLTASEWDQQVIHQKDGQVADYVVYESGGTWYADGPWGTSGTSGSDPATVLQHAATNGSVVRLCNSIPTDGPLTSTVTFDGTSLIGPGGQGQATVYVDGEQTSTGIKVTGTGTVRDIWLRGDPDTASVTFTTSDLLWLEDMGRGSLVDNVALFGTRGNGMVVAGCQQTTFRSIMSSTCGDPSSDTWHIYLTNSPTDGLETNANVWVDTQRHGSGGVDGGWIAMREDQHTDTDYPRTQHFVGINVENGPTDSSTPVVEVAGRDHVFGPGRIGNIDVATAIFQVVSGNRARDCVIYGLRAIAGTDDPATTDFWDANGVAVATPTVIGCPQIDMTGSGIVLDNYNQTNTGLQVVGSDFGSTDPIVDVTAGQDAGEAVLLSNVQGTGGISVQGARLAVSNVPDASWGSFADDFGPRLIANDGSFISAFFSADTAGGAGVAEYSFTGDFELINGELYATTGRGTGTVIEGTSLDDTSANGDLDTARAHVVNVSDGTDAADGVTVNFVVYPHR